MSRSGLWRRRWGIRRQLLEHTEMHPDRSLPTTQPCSDFFVFYSNLSPTHNFTFLFRWKMFSFSYCDEIFFIFQKNMHRKCVYFRDLWQTKYCFCKVDLSPWESSALELYKSYLESLWKYSVIHDIFVSSTLLFGDSGINFPRPLYLSPIPVGRRGVIPSFKWFFTCRPCA